MSRDPAGLPLDSLSAWLSINVSEFDSSARPSARLLTGGRSNLTYAVSDASGRQWAIRRPPLGHVMPSAHDMTREYRVMAGLHQAQFPVPRPWALCEDESVVGSKFLVMDFVDGLVIADQNDAAKLLPAEADRACGLLVEGLVELHSLDASAIGLGDFGRPEGYLVRQVRRWGQQWELSKTRELHDINVVAAWLKNRVTQLPQNLPWAIVHGDYRIDNVIINPEITSLRAVLDWEMSTLGDPLADLAISLVYWTQGNDILRQNVPVAQGVTSGPGFWTRQQIVDRYVQLSGLDLSHLGFCLVFACYKIAVIMESLNFRQKSGYQLGKTAELGEDVGLAVESLAQLGVRLLDENTVGTLQT